MPKPQPTKLLAHLRGKSLISYSKRVRNSSPASNRSTKDDRASRAFSALKKIVHFRVPAATATALALLASFNVAYPMVMSWRAPEGLVQASNGGNDEIIASVNNGRYNYDVVASAHLYVTDNHNRLFNYPLTIRDSDQDIGPFQTKSIVLSIPPKVKLAPFFVKSGDSVTHCKIEVFIDGMSISPNFTKDYDACILQFKLMKRSNEIS